LTVRGEAERVHTEGHELVDTRSWLEIDEAGEHVSGVGLSWYRSLPDRGRSFCNICGGSLFAQDDCAENIVIAAGTLDGPTGLKLATRIFARRGRGEALGPLPIEAYPYNDALAERDSPFRLSRLARGHSDLAWHFCNLTGRS